MSGERSSAETDNSAETNLFKDSFAVLGNICYKGIGSIDPLEPLVALNRDFNRHLVVAGEILTGAYRLDRTGNRRMDEG